MAIPGAAVGMKPGELVTVRRHGRDRFRFLNHRTDRESIRPTGVPVRIGRITLRITEPAPSTTERGHPNEHHPSTLRR